MANNKLRDNRQRATLDDIMGVPEMAGPPEGDGYRLIDDPERIAEIDRMIAMKRGGQQHEMMTAGSSLKQPPAPEYSHPPTHMGGDTYTKSAEDWAKEFPGPTPKAQPTNVVAPPPKKKERETLLSKMKSQLTSDGITKASVEEKAQAGEAGALPQHEQDAYDMARKAILNRKPGLNLKPLGALLDSWYGGNLAGAAPDAITKEDQGDALASLEMKIAARKTEAQEKERSRLDALRVNLEKAGSEREKEKMEHKIRKLELTMLLNKGNAAGKKTAAKDTDFSEFISANKKDIDYFAKDKGVDPYSVHLRVKKAADDLQQEQDMPRAEAYSTAYRLIKSGKLDQDFQKNDGGPNTGIIDSFFGG